MIPADKRAEALASVRNAVFEKIGGEDNLMPSAATELTKFPENFYIVKDSLHLIFAPYMYAPNEYGPVEVVIPAYKSIWNSSAGSE